MRNNLMSLMFLALVVTGAVTCFSGHVLAYDDYSGWWYVRGQEGTGLSVEIQDDYAFVAIYDYENYSPFWITSYGTVEEYLVERGQPSGLYYSGDIYLWNGWPLGTPYVAPRGWAVGSMSIEFESKSNARITYTYFKEFLTGDQDVTASVDLSKFMPDVSPGSLDARDINGWWYDPVYDGMGFFIEAYGNTVFMAWYHYGRDTSPWWWTCYDTFSQDDKDFGCDLQEWYGGEPLGYEEYLRPSSTVVGHGDFHLNDDGTANFTWSGETFHLERFRYN